MILVESLTNPMLKLVDLKAIVKIAQKHIIITVCDNTFTTPYIQQPLSMGLDIVSRSYHDKAIIATTKEESLIKAYSKMKLYNISQLPVLENDLAIGIIDEYDILLAT